MAEHQLSKAEIRRVKEWIEKHRPRCPTCGRENTQSPLSHRGAVYLAGDITRYYPLVLIHCNSCYSVHMVTTRPMFEDGDDG